MTVFWFQKPSILRACGGGGRGGGRAVVSTTPTCVCKAVSVEKGARSPPLLTAVVCPPGRRCRRRLAITAVC
jgi:hypothetical protein